MLNLPTLIDNDVTSNLDHRLNAMGNWSLEKCLTLLELVQRKMINLWHHQFD